MSYKMFRSYEAYYIMTVGWNARVFRSVKPNDAYTADVQIYERWCPWTFCEKYVFKRHVAFLKKLWVLQDCKK